LDAALLALEVMMEPLAVLMALIGAKLPDAIATLPLLVKIWEPGLITN